ncbi:hypothetical protein [Seleniivibrio woodruffii]|uniref:Respiratory nitrate reductase chaperone NarJ n=1 Tax=Seleniivibrio woodruffii TaxID=1078050 RepID=A0A4R1K796_9BACT|nr:hypothetical protein [Seleniivibrio woodruffii]TCK59900.1 respiratory nitrate reductase chaperone NarJ [Seleniivibrio woodruffii]TVZ35879.1 respiratory nitrate reductase chaperone NarJ [Seleniivibrio woodruffii]
MNGITELYSRLLKYPSDETILMQIAAETGADVSQYSLSRLQEEYVECFDFNPKAALTLTTHTAGNDSEKSDLMETMNALLCCYEIARTDNASPDYIPDVLSAYCLAVASEEEQEALIFLTDILLKGCGNIRTALKKGIYADLMKKLCSILESEVRYA